MSSTTSKLSLQEFFDLPESGDRVELVDGELQPKMNPTTPHSRTQKRLLRLLDDWCESSGNGEVNLEWAVALKCNGIDWCSVPDLTYISKSRIQADWDEDGPCPGIPELVIEIISPGQTFGAMTHKATNYLQAGVDRVWVVDTQALSVTIFRSGHLPQTFWSEATISDPLLPGLAMPVSNVFGKST